MRRHNVLLAGTLTLGLACVAQEATWETHMEAGAEAFQQGDHAEAERQLAVAVEHAEEFGADDPRLALSLNNLAVVYRSQGRYAEAEPLHERALAIREEALGPDHPDVATSLNNLAELYRGQGRYAEAEPLYGKALEIYEAVLGPDHTLVAATLANHAALLREMGRDAEADELDARAESIRAERAEETAQQ